MEGCFGGMMTLLSDDRSFLLQDKLVRLCGVAQLLATTEYGHAGLDNDAGGIDAIHLSTSRDRH